MVRVVALGYVYGLPAALVALLVWARLTMAGGC